MGTHILLDGKLFEEKYLTLPPEFTEERWQEILTLTADDMDEDISEYLGDRLALRKDDMRVVTSGLAVLQIYRAAVAECALATYKSWTCDRFWADMERGGYGDQEAFWPRLRDLGMDQAYLSLLKTAGLGYPRPPADREPWWLFAAGPVKGRFHGEWAGLTSPDDSAQLAKALGSTGVIEHVAAIIRQENPGLAKNVERDHREVMAIIELAAQEANWLLGFEFGTCAAGSAGAPLLHGEKAPRRFTDRAGGRRYA
jgi:hypothetical protein